MRKPNGHKAPRGNANGAGQQPSPPVEVTATAAGSPLARAASAVEQAAPEIVKALIEEAKQGSYLHAKFLFDFAGLSPPPIETVEDSLASRLLRALEIEEYQGHASALNSPMAGKEHGASKAGSADVGCESFSSQQRL